MPDVRTSEHLELPAVPLFYANDSSIALRLLAMPTFIVSMVE